MGDILLAEFHGYFDEKNAEILKLSIHYIKSLESCITNLALNKGIPKNFSHFRDIIEVIRICSVHGILIRDSYKENRSSMFHFVKIFPEIEDLKEVDDMCFLAFLVMNKVFSTFLDSLQSPTTFWHQRVAKYFHQSSILRYPHLLKQFTQIAHFFEINLNLKTFHIPNCWLTYFAKLSLRWNSYGSNGIDAPIRDYSNLAKHSLDSGLVSLTPSLLHLLRSEENLILKNSFDNEQYDKSPEEEYSGTMVVNHSEITNENLEKIHEDYQSKKHSYFSHSFNSDSCSINKDDSDNETKVKELEELLENLWQPLLYLPSELDMRFLQKSNKSKNGDFNSSKNRYKSIVLSQLVTPKRYSTIRNKRTPYVSDEEPDQQSINQSPNFDDDLNHINSGTKIYESPNLIKLVPISYIPDNKEWYLRYYTIPLDKTEESSVLNLQDYKCCDKKCRFKLDLGKLHFCCFTGFYYCSNCYGDNQTCIIPGLLAKFGSFTPLPVAANSLRQLKSLESKPLINVNMLTADIWITNQLIKKLVYARRYLLQLWLDSESADQLYRYMKNGKDHFTFLRDHPNSTESQNQFEKQLTNISTLKAYRKENCTIRENNKETHENCSKQDAFYNTLVDVKSDIPKKKCQYKESIKRRLQREYGMNGLADHTDYFSVLQLIQIGFESFSQEITMNSSDAKFHTYVDDLTKLCINWSDHQSKCLLCNHKRYLNS
ncbi:uncharacterized protein CMU_021690 [Cryptosporidium muris RN66]|uniref:Rubicon Homology domain-containing protein n=1 Tax=Cryptosporidium muris (strain RN66) TaxID=441375 RepID=B6AJL4_CRYMR|nr:uncharacterized protein CMU_021690 [Cryptosporidium muris RN66]EEA08405.1 hypothetical protein, conserved [Cryptosporidium muris RN66]|eukprot:XP_002142754.1 hypothetical protein [Cryptosporidium muris RN66]